MRSTIYHIQSEALQPFVQYILFNQCSENESPERIISFPNTNYCLGIQKDTAISMDTNGMHTRPESGIHTYISGLYTSPHVFHQTGKLDEICIDFTMAGYFRFFPWPPLCYQLNNQILTLSFGAQANTFFHTIFQQADLQLRGQGIEQFLLFCIQRKTHAIHDFHYLLAEPLYDFSVSALAHQLKLSERSTQRFFRKHFAITPKQYLRIRRFRSMLEAYKETDINTASWESLAYTGGYFDYSHLYRELKQLTGLNPTSFFEAIEQIDSTVIVGTERVN